MSVSNAKQYMLVRNRCGVGARKSHASMCTRCGNEDKSKDRDDHLKQATGTRVSNASPAFTSTNSSRLQHSYDPK